MEEGFLLLSPSFRSLYLSSSLCSLSAVRVLHGHRGEKGEVAEREKMFKCRWQPLVAAGTGVSALILPQHGADRQMIEKEPGRRRNEKRRWGESVSRVCDGVRFLRHDKRSGKEKGGLCEE